MRLCAAGRERASVAGAMRCEHYMRGSLLGEVFAAGAKPTDILVSGDVDEIPRPEYLRPFRDCSIFDPRSSHESHPTVVILLAKAYMYNIGCDTGQDRWSYGPKVGAVFQFDMLRDEPWRRHNGMNSRRWGNTAISAARFADSAWHLTNFMTPEALAKKLEGFFHFRDLSDADRTPSRLSELMARCKSPYPGKKYRFMRGRRRPLVRRTRTRSRILASDFRRHARARDQPSCSKCSVRRHALLRPRRRPHELNPLQRLRALARTRGLLKAPTLTCRSLECKALSSMRLCCRSGRAECGDVKARRTEKIFTLAAAAVKLSQLLNFRERN